MGGGGGALLQGEVGEKARGLLGKLMTDSRGQPSLSVEACEDNRCVSGDRCCFLRLLRQPGSFASV